MPTKYPDRSVEDLLSLEGSDFITSCYLWLLYREPDLSGLAYYSSRIAAGDSRLAIAAHIASSDEARALPFGKKTLIAAVLGLHTSTLISRAWTPARRANTARQTQRYFEVIAGREPRSTNTNESISSGSGDPFKDYLNIVINATECLD